MAVKRSCIKNDFFEILTYINFLNVVYINMSAYERRYEDQRSLGVQEFCNVVFLMALLIIGGCVIGIFFLLWNHDNGTTGCNMRSCNTALECPALRMADLTQLSYFDNSADDFLRDRECWMHRCFYDMRIYIVTDNGTKLPPDFGLGERIVEQQGGGGTWGINWTEFPAEFGQPWLPWYDWRTPEAETCLNFLHSSHRPYYQTKIRYMELDFGGSNASFGIWCRYTPKCFTPRDIAEAPYTAYFPAKNKLSKKK